MESFPKWCIKLTTPALCFALYSLVNQAEWGGQSNMKSLCDEACHTDEASPCSRHSAIEQRRGWTANISEHM